MNVVEKILVYTELELPPNDLPTSWPRRGVIKITDAVLAYHEGLPLVLKLEGVSLKVRLGENVIRISSNFRWLC